MRQARPLVLALLLSAVLLAVPGVEAASRETVEFMQGCLWLLGFDPGPVDGLAGPQTLRALSAYQRDRFGTSWHQVPTETRALHLVAQCLAELDRREAAQVVKRSW